MPTDNRIMPAILDREISGADQDAFGHRHFAHCPRQSLAAHTSLASDLFRRCDLANADIAPVSFFPTAIEGVGWFTKGVTAEFRDFIRNSHPMPCHAMHRNDRGRCKRCQ
ncbi:hypothetical protein [Pseudomonas sp. LB3P14]